MTEADDGRGKEEDSKRNEDVDSLVDSFLTGKREGKYDEITTLSHVICRVCAHEACNLVGDKEIMRKTNEEVGKWAIKFATHWLDKKLGKLEK